MFGARLELGEVPTLEEARGPSGTAVGKTKRVKSDRTAQMNLRVRPDEKRRIGLVALRENVSINEIFSRMLELYEREHGRAELAPAKSKAASKK